ncbi:E3 ubiquitin-protein ligase MARCH2 [Fasciola gigantica]|uniref:E3 ubiquitin-protein ligase MARCH2 n=1 Tax=Fasciola gigantica TaxID=46835 RepID=A0A504Y6P3_FASGI|nr:E3 ubiquitin-protein ligase MARCH2 [Fasciola gigantica]
MSQSPFQSSSHQTAGSCIDDCKIDKLNLFKLPNNACFLENWSLPRSPNRKTILLNTDFTRVLNAPRPSLELNDDNLLFANQRFFQKQIKHWRKTENHILNNGALNSSEMHSTPAEHVSLCYPIQTSLVNMHRTSTPHMRLYFRHTDKENMFNSALIGAPRLALNQSLSSSLEDSGTTSSLTQTDYAGVAASSFEEESVPKGQYQTQSMGSPTIQPRHVARTELSKKLMEMTQNSTTSSGRFRCRICLEEGDSERVLLSPCRCKGTMGLVHRHCLQHWLLESGKVNCELCGYAYIMTPSRRRSALGLSQRTVGRIGTFQDWLQLRTTRRHLLTDLICLILLTPSTYLGVYFCAVGAENYAKGNALNWKFIGLWGLAVLLMTLFTLWVLLAIRHHWNNYHNYRCYQRRRANEEMERMASIPRWRFSIQPRPRGSSIYLHPAAEIISPLTVPTSITARSDSSRDFSTSEQCNTSLASELEVQTQVIPGIQSRQRMQSTSQQIVLSVALSAVPEVTEEYTPSNADKNSENTV